MRKALLFSSIFLISCSTYRQTEPVRKPLSLNESQLHGQLIYMKNCQPCHPQGEAGAGWGMPQIPTPGIIYQFRVRSKAITLGLGKMPAFKKDKINKSELKDLVGYIKAMRKNNRSANS